MDTIKCYSRSHRVQSFYLYIFVYKGGMGILRFFFSFLNKIEDWDFLS